MANPLFEVAAALLEQHTSFSRLEARGTLRLALKQAGLEPGSVTDEQLRVAIERVLPRELLSRGIPEPLEVCRAVMAGLEASSVSVTSSSATRVDDIFRRLGD